MGFEPERARRACRIEPEFLPPPGFIAMTMDFAMMSPTERHCELVTDSSTESPVLRKAQMMGVARLTSADQTRLLGNKAHVLAIAYAARFGMRQNRLVDRR